MRGKQIYKTIFTEDERMKFINNLVGGHMSVVEIESHFNSEYSGCEMFFVSQAFPWENTPEGPDYWCDLALKIQDYREDTILPIHRIRKFCMV